MRGLSLPASWPLRTEVEGRVPLARCHPDTQDEHTPACRAWRDPRRHESLFPAAAMVIPSAPAAAGAPVKTLWTGFGDAAFIGLQGCGLTLTAQSATFSKRRSGSAKAFAEQAVWI